MSYLLKMLNCKHYDTLTDRHPPKCKWLVYQWLNVHHIYNDGIKKNINNLRSRLYYPFTHYLCFNIGLCGNQWHCINVTGASTVFIPINIIYSLFVPTMQDPTAMHFLCITNCFSFSRLFHEIFHDGTTSDAQHYELNRSGTCLKLKTWYFVTIIMMGTKSATLYKRKCKWHQSRNWHIVLLE